MKKLQRSHVPDVAKNATVSRSARLAEKHEPGRALLQALAAVSQTGPNGPWSLPPGQIRKSAVSMPSNVAEGHGRHYTPVYIQHLWTAHASGAELETQIGLGRRVEIVTEAEAALLVADAQEIGRMIQGLVRSLERAR